jgi:formylglycine-generating enzyme required for sulfatase activity
MGAAEKDPQADADEKPAHQVTLSEFWLGDGCAAWRYPERATSA